MHPTKIIVDTARLIQNINNIKAKVGDRKFCLPVKANAYGHGIVKTSLAVEHHVDYLAVACFNEALQLKNAGIKKPILIFGAFDRDQAANIVDNNFEVTVTSLEKAKLLSEYCSLNNSTCKIHVKIDTGMNRVGSLISEAYELIDYVVNNQYLILVGVYSHLASSDSPNHVITEMQIERFSIIVKHVKSIDENIICHLANSGAVTYHPDAYFDMVRPGILSYGYYVHEEMAKDLIEVKPCLSLMSRIVHFKHSPSNEGISYGHRYKTINEENIATIPIGYGDGYRRSLSNKGQEVI
ncbi:MAG: alanine racemase, partial [Burkholderiales bacterium]|nr:alanine racemase [Burkholderiales bacterium]